MKPAVAPGSSTRLGSGPAHAGRDGRTVPGVGRQRRASAQMARTFGDDPVVQTVALFFLLSFEPPVSKSFGQLGLGGTRKKQKISFLARGAAWTGWYIFYSSFGTGAGAALEAKITDVGPLTLEHQKGYPYSNHTTEYSLRGFLTRGTESHSSQQLRIANRKKTKPFHETSVLFW